MTHIKTVTSNDVADAILDKNSLALRQRERQIMSEYPDTEQLQIVSLGKKGITWAGEPEVRPTVKTMLWDFTACGIPYVWSHYGARGDNVNVFVLDTGIDQYHPAFTDKKITAKSFVSGASAIQDGCGHGTWVCGKIVGGGIGLSPNCNLYSLRVLDDSGTGSNAFTNKALEWILNQNVFPHVINMSLGGPNKNSQQEKLLWQLYRKGSIIVVASGNEGSDDDRFYPAAYDGVLAVGAVDKQKTRAEFSNYGANIAVCAPGVACYSAYPGSGFRLLQGTSMASPTVAGLITLGLSYALSKGLDANAELRDKIISSLETSAQDLGVKGRDPYYGFGCIDGRGFFEKLDQQII